VAASRALRTGAPLLAGGALAAAVGAGAATADRLDWPFLLAGVAAGGLVLLALTIDLAWTFSAAIVLSVLSGNAQHVGLPIPPDRVAVAVGLGVLVLRSGRERPLRFGFAHWALVVAAGWAIVSAAWANTLTHHDGLYGLLDRFGLVPFLLFVLAPRIFPGERERMILIGTLVGLGLYLGLTAVLESVGLDALIFPRYIADPSVGIHFGRARGPFVEAVADGLALFGCGVAAAVAFTRWRAPSARWLAAAVVVLDLVGILLTLTRAVWIAAAVVPLVVMLSSRRLARYALPAVLAGVVVLGAVYTTVPGLSTKVDQRSVSQRPVWDRINTDDAALRMVAARPLTGFGWDTFRTKSVGYMRQHAGFPITGVGIPVHNVPLSHAVELGLVGLALWALAFAAGVLAPALRRAPPALEPFRLGLLALALCWLIVACFGPLGYAFPTLLLWTWAGVVHAGREVEA
jgi:putative inorganic carbon (HCO3(-)) transporter